MYQRPRRPFCPALLLLVAVLFQVSAARADDPVIDYSTVPALESSGAYQYPSWTKVIACYGRYIYGLAENGSSSDTYIRILRWDPDTSTLVQVSSLSPTCSMLSSAVVAGQYLCVSYQNVGKRMDVYDLADPESPVLLSTYGNAQTELHALMTSIVFPDGQPRFVARTYWPSNPDKYPIALYSIDPMSGIITPNARYEPDYQITDISVTNTTAYFIYTDELQPSVRSATWYDINNLAVNVSYSLNATARNIAADSEESRVFMSYQNPRLDDWTNLEVSTHAVVGPEIILDDSKDTVDQVCYEPFLLRSSSAAGDHLHLYDASCPDEPFLYSSCNPSEAASQILVAQDTIFTRSSSRVNAQVIRQAYPAGSASHPFVSATDIVPYHKQGGSMSVCYVAGSDGIRAYYTSVPPLSDPLAPALVQGWGLANGFTVNSLSLSDNDMLVACIGRNVHTWKIGADPTQLTAFKTCQVPVDHSAEKALVYAGKLYVACGGPSGHLRVYSMPATEAGSITFLWEADTAGPAVDLVVQKKGTYVLAYVAEGNAGIEIFRTGDANGITKRGGLDTDDAQSIAIQGLTLYVADGAGGAKVIDATTPTSPVLLATLCGRDVQDVCVSGQELYALDGKLVRVFDVSTPSSPVRRGFLNAEAAAKALNATNRLWLADDDMIKLAYMQIGSAPSVVPTTQKADVYLDVSSNVMVWEFSWRTKEWTNPDLMKVVVRNPVAPSPGCLDFGATGMTFGYGDVGVSTFVRPSVDGGWLNTLRMEVGSCDTDCQYAFKGRCAIEANGMAYSETDEVSYSTPVCVQYQPGEE